MLSVLLLFTASDYPLVSFGHCVVCSSSIYGIWLPFGIFWPLCCLFFFYLRHPITLWYLLATVLSVLLLFTASDYPFGIFCPLCCLFFFYLRHLITLWYLLATVLSVLLFTASDYPLVSFGHCVVCSSSIYRIRLPFGIFWPLCCLFFFYLRHLITLWYLLAIVLSVLLFTASDYPLVSFGQCVVCSSSIYGILLPFGIFWPLCCLFFFCLRHPITLWYLLATVLVVCSSSIYGIWLPFGIFWPLCCLFFFYLRHPITLWYLLATVLSVLLLFMASDYPLVYFGHCSSSIYGVRLPLWYLVATVLSVLLLFTHLITLWYLLATVLSVLLFTASDYPLVSFGHCVVCSSSIYASDYPLVSFGHCVVCSSIYSIWLPFGIFWSLCCLFFYLQHLITLWYLLATVLSVLLLFTHLITLWYLLATVLSVLLFMATDYPLVSFGHCVVCSSSIYGIRLPFGILWALCCLFFFYLRHLITLWYLLAIVLSVLLFTASDYPLVSFGQCVVCSSSIYGIRLPFGIFWPMCCLFFFYLRHLITLWYLLATVLSVLLLFTASDYPLVYFGHCVGCLFFFYLRHPITLWYLVATVLSVLLLFTASDYPLVSFGHCVVCSSSIYGIWLPFGIFWSLCCLFFYLRHPITLWYLLDTVFSVLLLFTASDYPLVSFGHCVVCSSSIYGIWLPFGIFWSLCCLFFYLRHPITLWYLLDTALSVLLLFTASVYPFGIFWPLCWLSVLLLFTASDYPLVSVGHCVVCSSSIYGIWLPFGIFWSLCCLFFFYLRHLITLWYLLATVLSVLLLFTASDYPLVSFGHCVVCSSSIYGIWLPFGIFWSLCCLFFFYLQHPITHWYLLATVLSVLLFRASDYSLVSFGHCVVCSSSIYGIQLPLWYLLATVLSVLLLFTASDYPFGIFWPLCCLFFFYLRHLITLWYLLATVLSVLLLSTASDYPFGIFWPLCCLFFFYLRRPITPLVSFVHCVVCSSSIYGIWLPFGIFWPLCCLFFYLRHLITLWYLLAIVLSVLLLFTASDYPLVSFGHFVVCSSSIYGIWLPFGIFWPLCCLFFYLRHLITHWYLLAIVLSVLLLFTASDYPLVSFGQCVVCSSSIYGILLPFGIFWPLCCLFFFCLRHPITLWYLLATVLVVCSSSIYGIRLLFGIFRPLCCLFFFYLRHPITLWYLLATVLSVLLLFMASDYPLVFLATVLLLFTASDYPFGILCHCVVCSSSIYGIWLPFGIFWPLCCLFFFYLQHLITLWYLVATVLSVLLLFTASDYPMVSFGHCVVCSSSIYGIWLPFGIFWPLCCLFFFYYGIWLPLWYLLAIVLSVLLLFTASITLWYPLATVLSVLLLFTASDYPLVTFGHCVVCSSIYGIWLPFGIFWPWCCLFFFYLRHPITLWYLLATVFVVFFFYLRHLITLWYLLATVLSVLLLFSASDYPLVYFGHCVGCLFFFYLRHLITLWYLLATVLSVLLLFTASDYPLVSFGHCVVCSSSIYGIWLPFGIFWPLCCLFFYLRHLITHWYLLVTVLSVLLLFTASDYPLVSFGHCVVCSSSIYGILLPFGIFWPLCCLFFFYLRHLITLWYLLATVLSVLLFTASDYPLVSFGHCVVCSSSIYSIWLPLGIFWPLCCLFFFYLRHLITLWYLLVTVLSVLLLFTASDYPLVSFGHCVVCSSSIYSIRLPFGIFWPLCCLFFYLRHLITLWYLLVTVLSVLLLFTASDYPLVSFGHCVVCSSSIYGIWLPFGIFWPLCCLFFYLRHPITLWYFLATVLSVLLLFTTSDYPLVSFGHCVVCSSIYCIWLPFGIFWPLCCLFFFYLRHLITLWYLLATVLSVLLFMATDYPLVSFGHCVVCSSSIYGIRLPFGILWPLCCLFFFYLRHLITLWYLLAIVLSVLLFTASDYPLVSFGQCVVCSSSIYGIWLPFGIFWPLCCLFFFCLRHPITLWYILATVLVVCSSSIYGIRLLFGIFWPLCCLFFFYFGIRLPFGIFWPLCCLFFFYLRHPITLWYILATVLVVCSSSIYGVRLLFGILWPLCCLFFFYLRHLITLWYLLATVLSVLLLFTASDYPLVSFGHCVVCSSIYGIRLLFGIFWTLCFLFFFYLRHPITLWYLLATVLVVCSSSIYGIWLPFGIFWPLCCLFFFYLRHLITLWYLLATVLSVLLLFTESDYPLVSFGHCVVCSSSIYGICLPIWYLLATVLVVCSSSIYGIRLPLWYLLATVLSVLLLFTASDYPLVSFGHCVVCSSSIYGIRLPFGIFWPLCCCLFFFYLRHLITLWYLLATVLSVLLLFTASDYPLVSFGHCVVCSSSIYSIRSPFGIFWQLCCLFFYLGHPITLWYLLATVLSVLLLFTASNYPFGIFWPLCCLFFFYLRRPITPLVSFGHCVVCSSSIYGIWLPFGIFWPLCCLFFFYLRHLITLWYLLATVLSVLLLFTASDYPLVSFGQCVVCSSSIYGIWLPFGIFWPLCCLFFFYLRHPITPLVSFGHCVVCSSSIYGIQLPLWYLLATVLSVLLLFTASDYPFGIFWPLGCLFFFYLRHLITLWYLLATVLSVLLLSTASDYPLVSFGHCVVCSSSIYGIRLPFGIFWPLCCLFFFCLRHPITLWYILATVLVVCSSSIYAIRLLFGIFWPLFFFYLRRPITPLVSCGHCVVCSSSIYGIWLPFGIFWPLCCLFFFYLQHLITLWYLLATVLSVLLLFTASDYPLVSFGHCVVCSSSIYGIWLPFGIFWPLCCLFFFYLRHPSTLWYLFATVLSVLLLFTASNYPFGIFCPLCCLFFFYLRHLITLWYLLATVLSVLLFTASDYPLVSFGHCVVCFSSIYCIRLPFGIFWPLCCLFFFYLRHLLTLWYLLAIVLSVLLFTASDYPLVSFGHCVVCSSSIYGIQLPLWYLLATVLSVLLLFTASDYPLVSFGQCVVCSSSIYGIWLPFGIFWPLCCLFFFCLRHPFTLWYILATVLVVCSSSIYGIRLLFGIFWPLCCLFFFYLRHPITLWYLLATVLSVLLLFTASDYPLVSFGHCVVCSSSIYGIWLPFGIFWPLCCLFFFYLRRPITPLVSCGHCVVCSSSIYGIWLPFGIFWPLCCLFFFYLRHLISLWYLLVTVLSGLLFTASEYSLVSFGHCVVCSSSIYGIRLPFGIFWPLGWLSVLLLFTASDYPLVSFGHCVVCSSSIYGIWLPFGILVSFGHWVGCLFFFYLRHLITLWYLLATVLSVLLLFTASDYPLVSFGHCVGCLFFFYLRHPITPLVSFGHCVVCSSSIYGVRLPLWYLVATVLSVLLLFTASDYPLVSFGHCVVCSSSIYSIWLPFGILWPLCCLFFFYLRHQITPLVSFGHCVVCSFSIYGIRLPLWYLHICLCIKIDAWMLCVSLTTHSYTVSRLLHLIADCMVNKAFLMFMKTGALECVFCNVNKVFIDNIY